MNPGAITSGTLQLDVLIPTFLRVLDGLDPQEAGRIRCRYGPVLEVLGTGTLARPRGATNTSLLDFALQLTADLEEALAASAPEGLVFERRDFDYGFYPQEDFDAH